VGQLGLLTITCRRSLMAISCILYPI